MTEKNEIIVDGVKSNVVRETDQFLVVQQPDGKFKKEMKYGNKEYWSKRPETPEELVEFYQIMNSSEDDPHEKLKPMKFEKGGIVDVVNVYMTPYESLDDETGDDAYGINTMIEGSDGLFYVTSSKKAFFDLENMMKVFGKPDQHNYIPFTVGITHTKKEKGTQIGLKLLGVTKADPKKVN